MYNVLGQNAPEDSTQLLEGFQDLPKFLYATCYGVASPIMEENFYRGGFINILFEDKKIIGLILGSFYLAFSRNYKPDSISIQSVYWVNNWSVLHSVRAN